MRTWRREILQKRTAKPLSSEITNLVIFLKLEIVGSLYIFNKFLPVLSFCFSHLYCPGKTLQSKFELSFLCIFLVEKQLQIFSFKTQQNTHVTCTRNVNLLLVRKDQSKL